MPELRRNPVNGRWVVVATERARRPKDFASGHNEERPPAAGKRCPFCPGSEAETPPETAAYREPGTGKDAPGWRVRAIPNKFPAFSPDGEPVTQGDDLFATMNAVGVHEVIIETPLHDKSFATLSQDEAAEVIRMYRDRFRSIARDPKLEYVLIFRNHKREAGASLEHPHSQIIGTPVMPPAVGEEILEMEAYRRAYGSCVVCDMLERELSEGTRVVAATDHFVAIEPFASRTPFETWIIPRAHSESFGDLEDEEIPALAVVLRDVLARLREGLSDPAYNYMIHTAPLGRGEDGFEPGLYHWHVEIIPKLAIAAGFEMGTGTYINVTTPESAAEFLRGVRP